MHQRILILLSSYWWNIIMKFFDFVHDCIHIFFPFFVVALSEWAKELKVKMISVKPCDVFYHIFCRSALHCVRKLMVWKIQMSMEAGCWLGVICLGRALWACWIGDGLSIDIRQNSAQPFQNLFWNQTRIPFLF